MSLRPAAGPSRMATATARLSSTTGEGLSARRASYSAAICRQSVAAALSADAWTETLDINLKGTFLVAKHAIAVMLRERSGSIVNIASVEGLEGTEGGSAYNASKGGVVILTKNMAIDYGGHGIRVNCVCPGFIDTDMLRSVPEHVLEHLLARIPLGRFGAPEEIARGVLYLVRDGEYVTGTCLNINGGLYM